MTNLALANEAEDGVSEAEFYELLEEIAAGKTKEERLEHLPWREVWRIVSRDYWEIHGQGPALRQPHVKERDERRTQGRSGLIEAVDQQGRRVRLAMTLANPSLRGWSLSEAQHRLTAVQLSSTRMT